MTTDSDFHASRRKFLGASEVSQVLGISPFGSALDVYKRKHGIGVPHFTSEAAERGTRQEQFVLNEFSAQTGYEVRNQQLRVTHPEPLYGWAGATLDGVAYDGISPVGVVEAKTITTHLYSRPPQYYLVQVLWQLWVTGLPQGWLAVWSGKESRYAHYLIRIEDHVDLLQDAIEQCKNFWINHVLAEVPPPAPKVREREEVELPNDLLDTYERLGKQIKELEGQREQAKKQILEQLADETGSRYLENGQFKVSIARVETRKLSTKDFEKDHPQLAEQYKKPTYSFRLTVDRVGIDA